MLQRWEVESQKDKMTYSEYIFAQMCQVWQRIMTVPLTRPDADL